MTPEDLSAAIRAALQAAVDVGDFAAALPDEVRVERPRNRDHGDWSTNIALQLAKPAGMPPRDVATVLASRLRAVPGIASVDIAGPGFLNITLEAASAGELARVIRGVWRGRSSAGESIASCPDGQRFSRPGWCAEQLGAVCSGR